jgi:hypothetical protein
MISEANSQVNHACARELAFGVAVYRRWAFSIAATCSEEIFDMFIQEGHERSAPTSQTESIDRMVLLRVQFETGALSQEEFEVSE